jgi:hypothetical protein
VTFSIFSGFLHAQPDVIQPKQRAKRSNPLFAPASSADPQYDLSHDMTFFDPLVRFHHVLEPVNLGLQRNRP